ncbi:MAG: prepilin-type N-terminal cleavage/methylation domain-containing protein [Planctomycetota bacterium]|jgi:prepilin-type N-terminal cleavage/methylation domain-containing protein
MKTRKSKAGFTLIEMMISFSISLVLMGMVIEASDMSTQMAGTSLALGRLEEKASKASFQIATELRWAQPNTLLITVDNGSDRIDFMKAEGFAVGAVTWSTTITYMYQPSPLDSNGNGVADEGMLVRTQDGKDSILCRNVVLGSLSITQDGDYLQVQLSHFQLTSDKRILNGNIQTSATLINR